MGIFHYLMLYLLSLSLSLQLFLEFIDFIFWGSSSLYNRVHVDICYVHVIVSLQTTPSVLAAGTAIFNWNIILSRRFCCLSNGRRARSPGQVDACDGDRADTGPPVSMTREGTSAHPKTRGKLQAAALGTFNDAFSLPLPLSSLLVYSFSSSLSPLSQFLPHPSS